MPSAAAVVLAMSCGLFGCCGSRHRPVVPPGMDNPPPCDDHDHKPCDEKRDA